MSGLFSLGKRPRDPVPSQQSLETPLKRKKTSVVPVASPQKRRASVKRGKAKDVPQKDSDSEPSSPDHGDDEEEAFAPPQEDPDEEDFENLEVVEEIIEPDSFSPPSPVRLILWSMQTL